MSQCLSALQTTETAGRRIGPQIARLICCAGLCVTGISGALAQDYQAHGLVASPKRQAASPMGTIVGGKFYTSRANPSCPASQCVIPLARVPDGFTLRATNINCSLQTPAPVDGAFFAVTQGPGGPILLTFFEPTQPFGSSQRGATVTEEIMVFFQQGRRPAVRAEVNPPSGAPGMAVLCHLSGPLHPN